MALELHQRHDQNWVHVVSVDTRSVFKSEKLDAGNVIVPATFHALPDFRPHSEQACADALEGKAPNGSGLARFDPGLGPFSLDAASTSAWAQSLDFLRDIKSANLGSTKLSLTWVDEWLVATARSPEKAAHLFLGGPGVSSKTDRLIWRSRRILNCLAHVLPNLAKFDASKRLSFWRALLTDIAKIGAPTDTLWRSLTDGFDPLSPRAIWLRAVALLGVEAAFPGYLRSQLVDKAIEQIQAAIQSDGLIKGGSVVGTLSAGADLCMLARIPAVEATLQAIRSALASLRHNDGTLVTFGAGSSDYVHLLGAVLGPGHWKPATLLLESGIARLTAQQTTIWLRTSQNQQTWGAMCEIDVAGGALLTNYGANNSAVALPNMAQVTQARCKRRDEQDWLVMEANANFNLAGKNYSSVRQIRVSKNGAQIEGEDIVRPETIAQDAGAFAIYFAVAPSCACYLSKDKQSVLIVTTQQQAWRFRIEALDISVEIGSDTTQRNVSLPRRHIIVCRSSGVQRKNDFRAKWHLVLEDLE